MKKVTKLYICGVSCHPGGATCNNYCNADTSKPMPDSPNTYTELEMEESDMWENVIGIVRHHENTEKEKLELLSLKYSIGLKRTP